MTIPFAILAVAFHSFNNGWEGLIFSSVGMLTGMGLLMIPYIMGGDGRRRCQAHGRSRKLSWSQGNSRSLHPYCTRRRGLFPGAHLIRRNIIKGFFSEKLMILSSMMMVRQYVPIQAESSGQKPRLKYGLAIAFGTITFVLLKSVGIKLFA